MTSTTAVTSGLASPLLGLLSGAAGAGPASGSAPAARTSAARTTAGGTGGAKATTAKAPVRKATTAKKSGTAKKATTAKAGYATRLPADYAFLRDPKLSIEEKLSRFIGLLMQKSEQDLLRQMEKMAPGSSAASGGAGSTGGTGSPGGTGATGGAARPKAKKTSLWGIAKNVFPALNLASKVVGDAQLKQLASQLSGPVLAAAASAVGLPQLAPLALKLGPQLVGALSKEITLDLGLLTGGSSGSTTGSAGGAGSPAGTGGAAGTGSTGGSTGGTKAGAADGSTSEKAQLLELQRLQDRDKELFSLFSNMLKAMHDARMTSIQNIR